MNVCMDVCMNVCEERVEEGEISSVLELNASSNGFRSALVYTFMFPISGAHQWEVG
jgi:hypothetical protein